MKSYSADLHIHTVLSPCGQLEMSPSKIVEQAAAKGLHIIGITDHNSTRHCAVTKKLAEERGIFVLCGAEVTSIEEVHCLCFFPNFEVLATFQEYLDRHILGVKNDVNYFGYQVQVDENENIVYEEEKLLIQSINQSVNHIQEYVHAIGGLFIPAHVNRSANSLLSQLGFIPDDLRYDALEISKHISKERFLNDHPELSGVTIIQDSDAHMLHAIGEVSNQIFISEPSFEEIRLAFQKKDGRYVV